MIVAAIAISVQIFMHRSQATLLISQHDADRDAERDR
jgi:hypothetical protein